MVKRLFEIGQKVTPIRNKKWVTLDQDTFSAQPKFGKIYTVSGYNRTDDNFISLEEFAMVYTFQQTGFAPVLGEDGLERMLNEELEFAKI